MKQHKISWLNIPGYIPETWNPIIGCSKVSDGCKNCYAEKMAYRLMHMPFTDYYQFVLADNGQEDPDKFRNLPKWNGKTHLVLPQLEKPLHWEKPRAVFVCSMGDLFHENTSFEDIDLVFKMMHQFNQHIYIIPTKRPERMLNYYKWVCSSAGVSLEDLVPSKTDNYWLGVSVENQQQANERIPKLLQIPAAKHFVSIEPMLGAIDLNRIPAKHWGSEYNNNEYSGINLSALDGGAKTSTPWHLDWVIVGGESGPHARPMHPDWARTIRDQCQQANVPFFFKQWGRWMPEGTIKDYNFLNPKYEKTAGIDVLTTKPSVKNIDLLDGQQHHHWPNLGS